MCPTRSMLNDIIDIYYKNSVEPADALAKGVPAIIHKASEATDFKDPKYQDRRKAALDLGLLWGAYHLSSAQDPKTQVDWFLKQVGTVDDTTLLALDWEKSAFHGKATLDQTYAFVTEFRASSAGRYPVLYGGSTIREGVGGKKDELLAKCPVWYIRLKSTPDGLPTATWPTYTLWQYSDGTKRKGVPDPPTYDLKGADWSAFQGTLENLQQSWPFIST